MGCGALDFATNPIGHRPPGVAFAARLDEARAEAKQQESRGRRVRRGKGKIVMSKRKKDPADPRIVLAQENVVRAQERFTRSYAKARRAFKAMEKERTTIVRLRRQINKILADKEADKPAPDD
jgi:hypothetical protein